MKQHMHQVCVGNDVKQFDSSEIKVTPVPESEADSKPAAPHGHLLEVRQENPSPTSDSKPAHHTGILSKTASSLSHAVPVHATASLNKKRLSASKNRLLRVNTRAKQVVESSKEAITGPDPFYLKHIVQSTTFSVFISLVILANAIQIGWETDQPDATNWKTIELIFLFVYSSELLIRLAAYRWNNFTERWFLFDSLVVIISVLDLVGVADAMPGSGSIMVLRMVRIMKLVRIVRLFRFCTELCLLMSSLTTALRTVAWMWMLIGMLIYAFSIVFCNELGQQFPDDANMQTMWGTVLRSSFTLFTILTLDGWSDAARMIWFTSPGMLIMMLIFIAITTFAIVNVVVAVIVQHVVSEAVQNKDMELQRLEKDLMQTTAMLVKTFSEFDEDQSHCLTREEYANALKNTKFRKTLRLMGIEDENLGGLFDEIDFDQTGTVSVDEFIQGALQMRGGASARRLFELHGDLMRNQRMTEDRIARLEKHVTEGFQNVQQCMKQLQVGKNESGRSEFQEQKPTMTSDSSIESLSMIVNQGFQGFRESIEDLHKTMKQLQVGEIESGTSGLQEKQFALTSYTSIENRSMVVNQGFQGFRESFENLHKTVTQLQQSMEESRKSNCTPQASSTPHRSSSEQSADAFHKTDNEGFHILHQSIQELKEEIWKLNGHKQEVPVGSPSNSALLPSTTSHRAVSRSKTASWVNNPTVIDLRGASKTSTSTMPREFNSMDGSSGIPSSSTDEAPTSATERPESHSPPLVWPPDNAPHSGLGRPDNAPHPGVVNLQ